MIYFQYLLAAVAAYTSKSLQFRLGAYEVAFSLNGAPTHTTLAAALLAVEMVLATKTGTFTSGDITVSITPYTPTPSI